jgi:hypothetical protein
VTEIATTSKPVDVPPQKIGPLALWLQEGVHHELVALQKEGGTQEFEVISGQLIESPASDKATFKFILADGTRIPEDASGRLKTSTQEYNAEVISQQGNTITIEIRGPAPLPTGIPRAMLQVNDTALLEKLEEVLKVIADNPSTVSALSVTIFHPNNAKVGTTTLPEVPSLKGAKPDVLALLEKICGSEVTYLWGPPGTGKTYRIAYLITALLERGERVLVTSHTHAAVDQALYEAVKADPKENGPLFDHELVKAGKVLRVGKTTDKKVPEEVRLDKVVEREAGELQEKILQIEDELKPLRQQLVELQAALSHWDTLEEYKSRLLKMEQQYNEAQEKRDAAEVQIAEIKQVIQQKKLAIETAQKAWFGRTQKVAVATKSLNEAEALLKRVEQEHTSFNAEMEAIVREGQVVHEKMQEQQKICEQLPAVEELRKQAAPLQVEIRQREDQIGKLQEQIAQLEKLMISQARAIFCTLTKNYVGNQLERQKFDAVIVDEISMALPPLLFLAACRASKRVILVGDFLQLPPVVRSDNEVSDERLKRDIFQMSGVAKGLKPADDCRVLQKLDGQRRMLPQIAHVARNLVYSAAGGLTDDPSVMNRDIPGWLNFLPEDPLVIVDTADLHCWCGKQAGSLSRFNMYSATVAVELGAMAAAHIPKPGPLDAPPIGIVTPFAAQRRLLTRLVQDMGLSEWITAGTVHTFQGGQADLIIFDSVLDEPYWSARLTTPSAMEDVKKDLNVAVTRAKSKFVFIGSSEWLNKHAKVTSALGAMWSFIKDRSALISATELVEEGFNERVASTALGDLAWKVPQVASGPAHEILDETKFFERFSSDIQETKKSFFGLIPFFGEYRWPQIQPLLIAAADRGVEVTLVTPPAVEAENTSYVQDAIRNLREHGIVVTSAEGLHGKDIVLDEKIHYTGSLNWASHRGRAEIMHRIESPSVAKLVLRYMQARYIRQASMSSDGKERVCPECGGPVQVINQRRLGFWDKQTVKIGCVNHRTTKCNYLRNVDERPPFIDVPRCKVDKRTKFRKSKRGKGEVWQCPKHPRQCGMEKVIPGDPGTIKRRSRQLTLST